MQVFNCAVGDEIVLDDGTVLTVEEIDGDQVLLSISGGEEFDVMPFEEESRGRQVWVRAREFAN